MLDPQKVYELLSSLSRRMRDNGERALADELDRARMHFVIPLTSEFYGLSMTSLKKVLYSNPEILSDEDKTVAISIVREIEGKWFHPT